MNIIYDTQNGIEGIPLKSKEDPNSYEDIRLKPIEEIKDSFNNKNIKFNSIGFSNDEFEEWLNKINFQKNFKVYYDSFIRAYQEIIKRNKLKKTAHELVFQKYFEQFIATKIMLTTGMNGVIDIACDKCPFVAYANIFGAKNVIGQDLITPPEKINYLNNNKVKFIKSNANNIPLNDNSIDFICLLNSWEHFQAPTDFQVLKESLRLLRPNGKLLITPINLFTKSFVSTDPSTWDNKQVYKKGTIPLFRKKIPVSLAKNKQVYAQCFSPQLLNLFLNNIEGFCWEINRYSINNSEYKIDSLIGLLGRKD